MNMRWSIIRLIWMRELRDQLRDRRTLFMIAVLPIFLYPVVGVGLLELARGYVKPSVIEVQGADQLPQPLPEPTAAVLARFSAAGSAALALNMAFEYPPLFVKNGDT